MEKKLNILRTRASSVESNQLFIPERNNLKRKKWYTYTHSSKELQKCYKLAKHKNPNHVYRQGKETKSQQANIRCSRKQSTFHT